MNLTPRQHEITSYISAYRAEHGYSPTLNEIAEALDVSRVTIFEHVAALEAKHAIRRDKYKAGGITVIDNEHDALVRETIKLLDRVQISHRGMQIGVEAGCLAQLWKSRADDQTTERLTENCRKAVRA